MPGLVSSLHISDLPEGARYLEALLVLVVYGIS